MEWDSWAWPRDGGPESLRGNLEGQTEQPHQRSPLDSKVAFISSSTGAKSLNKYFPGVEERLSSQP